MPVPDVRVSLNYKEFRRYRRTDEAGKLVMHYAERIAKAAGPGFKAQQSPGKNRARATVFPDTKAAVADNAVNLTVLKAITQI